MRHDGVRILPLCPHLLQRISLHGIFHRDLQVIVDDDFHRPFFELIAAGELNHPAVILHGHTESGQDGLLLRALPFSHEQMPSDVCESVCAIRKVILQCMIRLLSGPETADQFVDIRADAGMIFSFMSTGDGVGLAVV